VAIGSGGIALSSFTSLMMAVGLTAGGFLHYNTGGGFFEKMRKFEGNFRVQLKKNTFFAKR